MATSAYEYITLTGTIIPDTVDIRTEVENEYRAALGENLDVSPSTPQGVLITAETLGRDSVARNNAMLANQINPNIAGGIYFDNIWALTGGKRNTGSYTVVQGEQLAGVPGTVIPEGVTMQSDAGDLYASISEVTLDPSGNATVNFQALNIGALQVAIGGLTQIITGVVGWETATNPTAGIPGTNQQSDISARYFRQNTLAAQGTSLPEAIRSALMFVPGVDSNTFRENVSDMTAVIDGVTLVPHSIYACVSGGMDSAVAQTLLAKKSAGANWNGNTTVNVTDPTSGQIYPVQFDRPSLRPILVRITINSISTVADPVGSTIAAILAYAAGQINQLPGFRVGVSVSPFEISGAVVSEAPGIFVIKCEVAYADVFPTTYVVEELPIAIFEQATIVASSIVVIQS